MISDNDFETIFFQSWTDIRSKNLSRIGGLRIVFPTSLRTCEKCDFEQPSIVFLIFFNFAFDLKMCIFSCLFEGALKTCFFLILDRVLVQIGGQIGAKIDTKSEPERMQKQTFKNVRKKVARDKKTAPLCLPKRIKEPWNMVQSIRDTPLVPVGTVADDGKRLCGADRCTLLRCGIFRLLGG
jgi:hypothetical protein